MDFELSEAQKEWRDEVRTFLAEYITPELLHELWLDDGPDGPWGPGPRYREFESHVREKGWWGMSWPEEYGGLSMGPVEQQVLTWEFEYAGVPGPHLTVTSVAPTIMRHGTLQNKNEWLPGMASGEIVTGLGYSEPDAGTDLASLRTRAVRDGDEWVINGQKIWNSRIHAATHDFLLVRTDPAAPKHRGISIIMVPLDAPGVEIKPLITWARRRTNEAFFTNVRVPHTNLIGEENNGWSYITGALDLERGVIMHEGELRRSLDSLKQWCSRPGLDGHRPMDRPEVRRRLAEFEADLEVARLFSMEAASQIEAEQTPTITVSENKVYASELGHRMADFGTQVVGAHGQLSKWDEDAPMHGEFELRYRTAPLLRFAGGTIDVMKDIIAQRGHSLPSYGRHAPQTVTRAGNSQRDGGTPA
ncbi:acyl-CoA dehydrogenase family protein [Rhodococcus sp. T2V]|uniref:acyl-CoA dehydrogenase family protein n=1 Tax=Rhodococcus sp. T2V TaxID=3034164 RepID=UPI0023E1864E|nr:acyl-CoA dehydrogenase family protein [Rhodococcus sp. T2V]MDF3309669.1 acyl-CoA dehydrogenase family protein [Rhodococcus sp. T2V]